MTVKEYRVVWKRNGLKEKRKRYQNKYRAEHFIKILGPEPWTAYGVNPDESMCCDGSMCGCGGETYREHWLGKRKDMPPIEYVRLELREVQRGDWLKA